MILYSPPRLLSIAYVALAVEEILLRKPRKAPEDRGVEPVGKAQAYDPLYPHVYGESVQPRKAEQQGACRHLRTHAGNAHEHFRSLVIAFGGGDFVKAESAACHFFGGVADVFCPKARAQIENRGFSRGGKAFGSGKSVFAYVGAADADALRRAVADPLAVGFAKRGDYLFYPRDVVVLRNDERAQRLPAVLPQNVYPETRWVKGSNYCDIGWKVDTRTGRVIVIGAIDNLVKGAAGQAVQNMNLMFGLKEDTGLDLVPMFP